MGCVFVLVFCFILFRLRDLHYGCFGVPCDGDPLGLLQQPLFVDYSDLVRLVIVKWNHHSIYLCFLLLCGDIEPNPGPAVHYPCSACGLGVADDDRAVFCDSCNAWVHVSCDPSLSDSLYDFMVQQPSEDLWYCSTCMNEGSCSRECSEHSENCLSCVCLNARSVLPKRFDLLAYICSHRVDIMAITETFLDSSIADAEFCPASYLLFRRDRSRHGGGVLIFVRDNLQVSPRDDLSSLCDELLCLEVHTITGPVIFGVFYRPPTQCVNNLVALNNLLLSVSQYPIVLCGDFNLPSIDWSITFPATSSSVANFMCDLVRDNYLHQMVVSPTRHQSLLDLVLTNQPDMVAGVKVVDNLPLTDHDAVQFTLNVITSPQTPCKRSLYNYKKADLLLLRDILSHIPWSIIEGTGDIEDSWQLFKDLFLSAVNMSVPRLQWRRKKLKHWFSYQTIHLIRKKRRLYLHIKSSNDPSSALLLKYRSISNRVRRLTRFRYSTVF